MKWLHRLLNPHCSHCKDEQEEAKFCSSCETLRIQLEIANQEKTRLLDALVRVKEPEIIQQSNEPLKPIAPKHVPWRVKRQVLEDNDREQARLARDKTKEVQENQQVVQPFTVPVIKQTTVEELEKSLGVDDALHH